MSDPCIVFIDPARVEHRVHAPNGWTLMEAAVQNSVPGVIGECGGSCACATCHVMIAPEWAAVLAPPEAMELELLGCTATPATSRSRLGCQVRITSEFDGMIVYVAETQM
ncbi:2Fe-2S iron-sulfur cluster-binding protein [Caballeronia sp. DA-9]|uniref:2Fe-2S iron-sulfur cluster-binding protein n=1 Tax=Caballeronia sp. DA-9 TaxID=3436237 RepID=UPI003F67623D